MLMALLGVTTLVSAQELQNAEKLDSVFIDTKVQLHRKNSGKVVAKITSETIDRSAGKTVAQLINEISGIEINGSQSYAGQNLGYRVRGSLNRQVVIILDGVQVNDPSHIANDFDLRLVPLSNIKQIEVVKGASSVLYGSGAAAAVINITTKKSSDKPISAIFTSTLGTNQSAEEDSYRIEEFTNAVNVNGTVGRFFYLATLNNRYVDGLSAIAAPEGQPNFESDVYNAFNTYVNLGINLTENIKVSRFFGQDRFKTGFDNFDYTDADHTSESRQLRTGGNFQWKLNKGTFAFNDSYIEIDRALNDNFPVVYDARFYAFDTYLQQRLHKSVNATVGLNFSKSNMNAYQIPYGENELIQVIDKNNTQFTIIDPYMNVVYISGFGLNVNAGARLNTHSVYKNKLVYNLNPSFNFVSKKNTIKIMTSYSTAYITPSLFQIFDPSYGNEDLEPEENATFEAGLEYTTENNFRASVVYFNRNEKNFVDFVTVNPDLFISQYQNITDKFTASGVEVEISKRFSSQWMVRANYTFTEADERFAQRIAKHKINKSLSYQPSEKTNFALNYQYNTEREDRYFNPITYEPEIVQLNAYGVLDFSVSHQVLKNLKLFAAFDNIFNATFEELYRYSTRGRNMRLGFTLEF